MRWVSGASLLIALGVALAPGLARTAEPDPAVVAKADALAKAGDPSGAIFRADKSGGILHIQSGMVCVPGGAGMVLVGVAVTPGRAARDEVACEYVLPDGELLVSAVRENGLSLSTAAQDAFAQTKQRHPDAHKADSPLWADYPGLSDPLAASLAYAESGSQRIASAWVAQESGWVVIVKATYAANARHDAELFGSVESISARKSIRDASHHSAALPAAPAPTTAEAMSSAGAPNVYIVRQHAEPLMFPVTVKVDGRQVVTLSQGGYTAVRLAPGDHTFSLAWPFLSGQKGADLSLKVEGGRTYDLFVVGQARSVDLYAPSVASGFEEVAPDLADQTIRQCCKFKAPK